jgi:protein O-mannosyl-transferase
VKTIATNVTPRPSVTKNARATQLAGGAAIVLMTLLAYWPALHGQFVWDDNSWTTKIEGLLSDFSGLRAIWFQPTAMQQYYPLAGTSFWIDYHLWGFWPLPYHAENICLHAISSILFWRLLRRLKVPGAWLAGAIFAVHPVMVESVAWITERKNVLSLVLYLSALIAYGRFTGFWEEENDPLPRRWGAYALAFVLFIGALLTKTTAFSLPAVILLINWWKRGRIRFESDLLPSIPFFVVSIGFCSVTSWLEKHHVGAIGPEWNISFPQRCLIAGHVIWFYVGKLLWPVNLCFLYPRWELNAGSWRQWMYPVAAAAAIAALYLAKARIGRGPITASLFFVGTLFPSLGFMNAYFMRFSFVCDHWVYLSSLGFFALAAAIAVRIVEYLHIRAARHGFFAAGLAALGILTWRQCGAYADIQTLWGDTLAKNPAAWMAHYNLGLLQQIAGDTQDARAQYELAIYYNPNCAEADNNLAWLLATLAPADGGDPARAVTLAKHARVLADESDSNRMNYLDTLGVAYASVGRFGDAIAVAQQGAAMAAAAGQTELAQRMQARIELYRAGQPYRPSPAPASNNPAGAGGAQNP